MRNAAGTRRPAVAALDPVGRAAMAHAPFKGNPHAATHSDGAQFPGGIAYEQFKQ
jgi:hypothetical protein